MKTKAISKYNVAVTVQSGKVGNVRSAANRVDSNSNPRTACSRACSRPPRRGNTGQELHGRLAFTLLFPQDQLVVYFPFHHGIKVC